MLFSTERSPLFSIAFNRSYQATLHGLNGEHHSALSLSPRPCLWPNQSSSVTFLIPSLPHFLSFVFFQPPPPSPSTHSVLSCQFNSILCIFSINFLECSHRKSPLLTPLALPLDLTSLRLHLPPTLSPLIALSPPTLYFSLS